ncbi:uncharacterized protein LOC128198697 isoform X2 [Bicyclus anynana]|nr:uncharacterized protein LOC128198697 isoform X2 [Bicyclus anynana]
MLATAARLRWDPTLYVPARELFPREYRAAAAALPALAGALLLLAQLPPHAARRRRALLLLHGGGQLATLAAWAALGGWAWARGAAWARGPAAGELRRALALREAALALLAQLAHYHPLPDKLRALALEAQADAPRNLHALASCAALLAALQLLAAALALAAARPPPAAHELCDAAAAQRSGPRGRRLRATYRAGRLVPVS